MALFGLLIAFGAYLLLDTINPQLTTIKLPSKLEGNLNIGRPPLINTARQIEQAIDRNEKIIRLELENDLGTRQDGGKITIFDVNDKEFKDGKRFELTQIAGLTGDLRKKAITGGTTSCMNLGGEFKCPWYSGTCTCYAK